MHQSKKFLRALLSIMMLFSISTTTFAQTNGEKI